MEFNRLISLVIGFIVLILVFVWIGSRFRSATRTQSGATVTVTITPTPTVENEEQTGRSWNPFAFLFNRNNSPTPTPTRGNGQTITATISPVVQQGGQAQAVTQQQIQNPTIKYTNTSTGETTTLANSGITKIPETGASTLVLPLAFSALTLGAYLRKKA